MKPEEALYELLLRVHYWKLETDAQESADEALLRRQEDLQLAKHYRQLGDREAMGRSLIAACQWHRTYREALREKRQIVQERPRRW